MFGDPVDTTAGPERRSGWPAVLGPEATRAGAVTLRPLMRGDGSPWRHIRIRDEALISPWDATSTVGWADRHSGTMWRGHRAGLALAARRGEALPFAIVVGGAFAGQLTIGGVHRGVLQSAWVGYWVDSRLSRQGVATAALALATGHAFGPAGLHRLEATVAPENIASRSVLLHLGFREEGLIQRYLHVGGSWRDHVLYALTQEDVPGGTAELLARYRAGRSSA